MVRSRRSMARRLGFPTVKAFERWEDLIVVDHFAMFLCDYLAAGYTVVPERKGFVRFVDLENAVAERIQMLEASQFEAVLDPDKSEWTAKDHYKHFIVGVVADDRWLAKYGHDTPEICTRGWTPREMTLNVLKLLEFLIDEWATGPGDTACRSKMRR
ncbi:hypothetical protein VTK56DRAFT_3572 [Thermocarpiscus australiensis]